MGFTNSDTLKIVVVEDEVTMQLILKKYLGNQYEVEIFKDGVDAMAFLQQGNVPDLIISDLNTPVMGGLDLTLQLKASDFFNTIPIVILSGEESSEMIIKCLEAGADDYLVKPFNPKELEARLRVVLRRIRK
ncbi:MAG: response regulator transcription factor [Chitinophagaceae bacterium]|jgi:DNA-binding response OmpR family regulator|nr:response regulator transcription factor [Chitinophagaceae bacterium]MCA6447090.1 response regulator transcription factor [Chitinophagaceae bacterium]